jgi:hypothetical protein
MCPGRVVERIAKAEGIGAELSNGPGPPSLAPWGVTEPVDRFAWEPKPRLDKLIEDLFSFSNSLVCCLFVHWGYSAGYPEQFEYDRAILADITGRDLSHDEWYELRGFDRFGPTDAKLSELGLPELRGLIGCDG